VALKPTGLLNTGSLSDPRTSIDFKEVIAKLKSEGSVEGFKELRNYLLSNFNKLKRDLGSANVISLAIACDRHAIFADLSASKTKEKEYALWRNFQQWLRGEIKEYEAPVVEDVDTDPGEEPEEADD